MNAELIESRPMSVIERASRALSKEESEAQIKALVERSKPIVEVIDPASRTICHDSLMTLKTMRVLIEKRGKAGREEAVTFSKAVIKIENELVALITPEETRLAQLRDDFDAIKEREREAKVQAEIARVAAIQRRIDDIRNWPVKAAGKPSAFVAELLVAAQEYVIDPAVFDERTGDATSVLAASSAALSGIHSERLAHEAEAVRFAAERAELARLRAEQEAREKAAREAQATAEAEAKAERDRAAAEQQAALEQERQRLAMEAAQNARIAAERQAALDRQEAQAKALRAAEEARLAADRAELAQREAALSRPIEPAQGLSQSQQKRLAAHRPSREALIQCVAERFNVTDDIAVLWLREVDWELPLDG
jgi:hypothetical protein